MKKVQVLMATLALGLTLATPAFASESRMDALLYNMAFEDAVDVFLYPQLAPNYPMLTLYLPANVTQSYGGLIYKFNSGSALGLFIHRPMANAFNHYRAWSLAGVGSPFAPGAASMLYPAGQVFDIIYGNGRFGLDLRLFGQAQAHNQIGVKDTTKPNTMFGVDINAGISFSKDTASHIELAFDHVSDTSTDIFFAFGGRYLKHSDAKVNPVFAADLQFGLNAPKNGGNAFYFGIPVKGGMRISLIPDKLYTGLLVGLDLQMGKPSGGDTAFGLVIPTAELATEYKILSWMTLRTGIKGGWGIQFSGAGSNHPTVNQLAFNSGLGFNYENFTFDATIGYSFWQNGPFIIGGRAGLFGNTSITYNF